MKASIRSLFPSPQKKIKGTPKGPTITWLGQL